MLLPIILYLVLKTKAVGLVGHRSNLAPLDSISLPGRLLTVPSLVAFYLSKLVLPLKLASGYYWSYTHLDFMHVLLPLLVDIVVVVALIGLASEVRERAGRAQYMTYVFFASWAAIGLIAHLQIFPMDFTASESWFYFPMAGVLGLIGVLLTVFLPKHWPHWLPVALALVTALFGIRTAVRGTEWRDLHTLSVHDVKASKEDYVAYGRLAHDAFVQGQYGDAKNYAEIAAKILPSSEAYNELGLVLAHQGDYAGAAAAYNNGINSGGGTVAIYENISSLTLVYGDYATDKAYLTTILQHFSEDSFIWSNLAVLEAEHHDSADAKYAIEKAASYGQVNQEIYAAIMSGQPVEIYFPYLNRNIVVNQKGK